MQKKCIIIPCFNEENRLKKNTIISYINSYPDTFLIFVNDGSSDDTLSICKEIHDQCPKQISILNLKKNLGKAEAVRLGIIMALNQYDYNIVGFWDADLSTPLSQVNYLYKHFNNHPNSDAIFGSRLLLMGSTIERNPIRHLVGRIISFFISNILKISIYDTQCGAKLFKKDIAKKIFRYKFICTWLFDIEIILRIRQIKKSNNSIVEIPLQTWKETKGSKVPLFYIFKVPLEIAKLYKKYK